MDVTSNKLILSISYTQLVENILFLCGYCENVSLLGFFLFNENIYRVLL